MMLKYSFFVGYVKVIKDIEKL